ncbi:tripartite tricarboxylate transporter substrate binding protein [Cellulosimicrobium funkei]|nr:tripartite tricarboxylate transporter substrate binding protein [Cellulosimicrobium funkei]
MNIKRVSRQSVGVAVTLGLAVALSGCGSNAAGEEEFPNAAVDFILPSSPGGSTDMIGRAFGVALEEPLGQTVTPVNRQGANGAVGGKEALSKSADGYTITMLFQSLLAITPLAVEDSDPIEFEDMDVLTALTFEDYVLVVNAESSDAETLEELLDQDGLSFGTAGIGTGGQFSQALLLSMAEMDYRNVPMDGGGPAVSALLGSQVDAVTVQVAEAAPYIEDGSFTPLAVFNEERSEFLPDVPTAVELGYDIVVDQKRFMAAPAGLPEETLDVYEEATAEAMEDEEFTQFLEENYISKWDADADEVAGVISEARETFEQQLEEYDISLQG